jgi:hypothetical protein
MGKRQGATRNISGFYGQGETLIFDDDLSWHVKNARVNISSVGKVGRKRPINYGIAVFTGLGVSRQAVKDALLRVLEKLED